MITINLNLILCNIIMYIIYDTTKIYTCKEIIEWNYTKFIVIKGINGYVFKTL